MFEDHADHNTGYKTGTKWPEGKRKLYWGNPEDYMKKWNKEMPERGKQYLASREKSNLARTKQATSS
jgi:hypothetical protein